MEKAEGIIIRLTKLTDSSLIVHWCTSEAGLIKTVAKGARRPKSAFAGVLDLFVEGHLEWVPSRKSELHTLREVSVRDYRIGLRERYANMVVAAYFWNDLFDAHRAEYHRAVLEDGRVRFEPPEPASPEHPAFRVFNRRREKRERRSGLVPIESRLYRFVSDRTRVLRFAIREGLMRP